MKASIAVIVLCINFIINSDAQWPPNINHAATCENRGGECKNIWERCDGQISQSQQLCPGVWKRCCKTASLQLTPDNKCGNSVCSQGQICADGRCVCERGNNHNGQCVECPFPKIYRRCPSNCPKTCNNLNPRLCTLECNLSKYCVCPDGMVEKSKSDSECVIEQNCPRDENRKQTCGDEGGFCQPIWQNCLGLTSRKPQLCPTWQQCCIPLSTGNNCGGRVCANGQICEGGRCVCEKGHNHEGKCVECPSPKIYQRCPSNCPKTCDNLNPRLCTLECNLSKYCVCPEGMVEKSKSDSDCVIEQNCPRDERQKRTCGDEGGFCQSIWKNCLGLISKKSQLCPTWQHCCIPLSTGGSPKTCRDVGGYCQPLGQGCIGSILSTNRLCPWRTQCCIPDGRVSDCPSKGGTCLRNTWECFGNIGDHPCPLGQSCCLPRVSDCPSKGGTCLQNTWECFGRIADHSCPLGQSCCLPRISDCPSKGGTCLRNTWECFGNIADYPCPLGHSCCLPRGSDCLSKGGTCLRNTWECFGRIAEHSCPLGQSCCLPRGSVPTLSGRRSCTRRGGKCTNKHCHGQVLRSDVFGIELCNENMMCCLGDPDKKCKDACGECVDDTKCNGKIIKGLCGGKKICCFKIDRKKHAGCIRKGGSNAVCMKIECDGYFVRCNKNKQSQFCPDHKKMECCFAKGKKPKAGAADCKAAGGKCDCNPCPGEYFPNTEGNQLCEKGKKCCIVDPMLKCKQGGGKCQLKAVKCKGPYLSGFCGPGATVCCFEGDFTKIQATGASEDTARGAGGKISKLKGVPASEAMAAEDLAHLKKLKAKINKVAAKTGIDAAIIAAIISRETRGGRPEHTKNPKSFGAMQLDGAKKRNDPLSQEHLQEATEHLVKILKEIFGKFPCWSLESKLKGAIAGYNLGSDDVKTLDKMDKGTPGDDYSSDVVARAKWLRSNKHF